MACCPRNVLFSAFRGSNGSGRDACMRVVLIPTPRPALSSENKTPNKPQFDTEGRCPLPALEQVKNAYATGTTGLLPG